MTLISPFLAQPLNFSGIIDITGTSILPFGKAALISNLP
jgi:hypothetical protein